MAIGSILVGLALLALVGIFIARPFLRPQERSAALTEQEQLLIEKEALLDQIQALDFDHETGKLPTEVHALQRGKLVEQATAVLQALDTAGGAAAYTFDDEAEDAALMDMAPAQDGETDIEIEAAIARMRQQRSQAPHRLTPQLPPRRWATGRHAFAHSVARQPTPVTDFAPTAATI